MPRQFAAVQQSGARGGVLRRKSGNEEGRGERKAARESGGMRERGRGKETETAEEAGGERGERGREARLCRFCLAWTTAERSNEDRD
eukprot:791760-Rhodomonas_salina.2